MPGMGKSLSGNDPTVVAAFHTALVHQLIALLVLGGLIVIGWNVVNTVRFRQAVAAGTIGQPAPARWPYPEPAARRVLRIVFGALWILDGLLQAQSGMPLGLPGSVLTPAAGSSPGWVQHLVNVGATIWSDHPVSAATSAVWIQVGIGVFLIVAPRGIWSRAAGILGAGWGLVIWSFGEAFGGVFGHGSSWLLGSPGAALFYVAAGVLVALPDPVWESPRLGRLILRVTGVFFIVMGLLQAWPGRGYWTGHAPPGGVTGNLASMADQMAQVHQPALFAAWERSFRSLTSAHGWGVNLVATVVLLGVGACLVSGNLRLIRVGVAVALAACLADWVLVEDFGFFGGVGTDPNSMIPMATVYVAGYVAMVRVPQPAADRERTDTPTPVAAPTPVGRPTRRLDLLSPSYLARTAAAVVAVVVVLVGAAPMALASTNPNADPIVAEAAGGTPDVVDQAAPAFTLTDEHGRQVSLHGLAGHTVVLTFIDPVCTTDCPLIAQELRVTDQLLGAAAGSVDLVAVVANPLYTSTAATRAFDRQEGLGQLANWRFLTGSATDLQRVWAAYGVQTQVVAAGAMVAHTEILYLIDRHGRTREILDAAPGTTSASYSSFSSLLAAQIRRFAAS